MQEKEATALSRREVITGAGVGIAAGLASIPALAAPKDSPSWDLETDVVCVGGGAAGCTAAIMAVSEGCKVILLERSPILGGTTRKSAGVLWIPNHPLMRDIGMVDKRDDCLRYMARCGYPHRYTPNSPTLGLEPRAYQLLETYYDNGSAAVAKLKALGAVDFGVLALGKNGEMVPDYAYYLPEDKLTSGRAISPKDASGKTTGAIGVGGSRLIDAAEEWLTSKGASILTEHRARKLIREGNRVIGVEATTGERKVRIRARKAVIFGSGGFAHNTELVERHQRMLYGACASPGSTGDLIEMSTAIGAQLGNMQNAMRAQVVLEEALANRILGVVLFDLPADSMVLVNKYGQRAVNEKHSYNSRTRVHFNYDAVREEYPNQFLFMIFDRRALDGFGGQTPLPAPNEKPDFLIEGATLAELSVQLKQRLAKLADKTGGADLAPDFPAVLSATIKRFNEYARSGEDPDFQRGLHEKWMRAFTVMRPGSQEPPNNMPDITMYPFKETGPYYAIILAPGALDTCSGPLINEKAQVLGLGGEPITGLYAAGNCASSPTGGGYFGAGGTLGPAVTFGYIAGLHAAAEKVSGA